MSTGEHIMFPYERHVKDGGGGGRCGYHYRHKGSWHLGCSRLALGPVLRATRTVEQPVICHMEGQQSEGSGR